MITEICNSCFQHFSKDTIAFVVPDTEFDHIFCCEKCMANFFNNSNQTIACAGCNTTGKVYEMIRGTKKTINEAWCSLDCASGDASVIHESITEDEVIDMSLGQEQFFGKLQK